MFFWVISDFQYLQVFVLDIEFYIVQFGDVRIFFIESFYKTFYFVVMVVMEFFWFYEIDFFFVGIIFDFVDKFNQVFQSVWFFWCIGICGCGDYRGSRGFLGDRIGYINKIKDYFYREKVNFIELKEFYYYYYDEMERFMRIFSEKYSDIIKLYSIGFSVQGRYLWVLEIIDNLGKYESGQLIFLFVNIFQYYFIIEKLKVD